MTTGLVGSEMCIRDSTHTHTHEYAEDFPLIFMGCDVVRAETLFTNFILEHNIALSAANHDICTGAHFLKSELQGRTIYVRYAQNLITTLKI